MAFRRSFKTRRSGFGSFRLRKQLTGARRRLITERKKSKTSKMLLLGVAAVGAFLLFKRSKN